MRPTEPPLLEYHTAERRELAGLALHPLKNDFRHYLPSDWPVARQQLDECNFAHLILLELVREVGDTSHLLHVSRWPLHASGRDGHLKLSDTSTGGV